MSETFLEYAKRIIEKRTQPLPEYEAIEAAVKRGEKIGVHRDLSKQAVCRKGDEADDISDSILNKLVEADVACSEKLWDDHQEICRAYYEYILENDKLRSAAVVHLLDFHAQVISKHKEDKNANVKQYNFPYDVSKMEWIGDESVLEYLSHRSKGEIASEVLFNRRMFAPIAQVSGKYVLNVLLMINEELLVEGKHFEEQVYYTSDTAINIPFKAFFHYLEMPEHVALPEWFDPDIQGTYGKDWRLEFPEDASPFTPPSGFSRKSTALPFPIWIDWSATKEEILSDFELLLNAHYIRNYKLMGIPVKPEGKSGRPKEIVGMFTAESALKALICWRIRKIKTLAGNKPYSKIFESNLGSEIIAAGIPYKEDCKGTRLDLSDKIKDAETIFNYLESKML